jgi:sugar phosphate permease
MGGSKMASKLLLTDDNISGNSDGYNVSISVTKSLYTFMLIGYLCMNIDHGIMPAATKEIQDYLEIDESGIGLLGSLVYLGNALGSVILAPIIQKANPKYIVLLAIFLNILTLVSFTLYKSLLLMSVSRIFAGVFQVALIIYFPVWVD